MSRMLAKLPRGDEAHSLDDHCRYGIIRNVDQGQKRAGAHPRDPRVAQSGEPTSTLRMNGGIFAGEGSKVKTGSSTSVAKSGTQVDSETQAGNDDVISASPAFGRMSGSPAFGRRSGTLRSRRSRRFGWGRTGCRTRRKILERIRLSQCCRNYVLCGKESCDVVFEKCTCDGGMRLRKELLQHAGAPSSVMGLIEDTLDTCRICRNWTRP